MPDETRASDSGGETHQERSQVADGSAPKSLSGESSPKSPTDPAQTGQTSPLQAEQPPASEEDNPTQKQRWMTRGRRAVVWAWKLFAELVTILWVLALWDSYRPKVSVTPGPTFDPKDPFATVFIIQNEGALPIRNVHFDTTWTYADDPNQARNVQLGVTTIPELKPSEQHAMIYPQIRGLGTNEVPAAVEIVPMPIIRHSLIMWFAVTYDPQFFGKRTATLYFAGSWNSDTNFQWLPTGSGDIRNEAVDSGLLKRSVELSKELERKRESALTNSSTRGTNSIRTKTPPPPATNDASRIHTG
jgi:hypothetical protein